MFERLGKIVSSLHLDPGIRRASECLRETDRHFWRNPAFAVDKVGQGLSRYAENFRSFRNGQTEGSQARYTHSLARMWGVLHRHSLGLLLVIINQLHVMDIPALNAEYDAPVFLDRSGPITLEIA